MRCARTNRSPCERRIARHARHARSVLDASDTRLTTRSQRGNKRAKILEVRVTGSDNEAGSKGVE